MKHKHKYQKGRIYTKEGHYEGRLCLICYEPEPKAGQSEPTQDKKECKNCDFMYGIGVNHGIMSKNNEVGQLTETLDNYTTTKKDRLTTEKPEHCICVRGPWNQSPCSCGFTEKPMEDYKTKFFWEWQDFTKEFGISSATGYWNAETVEKIFNYWIKKQKIGVSSTQQSSPKDITPNLAEYKQKLIKRLQGMKLSKIAKHDIKCGLVVNKFIKTNTKIDWCDCGAEDFNQALDEVEAVIKE